MSTITTKSIIVNILTNNGKYKAHGGEDPQVWGVYEYTNTANNQVMWKIVYEPGMLLEFVASPYVSKVVRLWDRDQGMSPVGRWWLEANK